MSNPTLVQTRDSSQQVPQNLLDNWDGNESTLQGFLDILNVGPKQFCHKAEALSILFNTGVDELIQKADTMTGEIIWSR